MRDLVSPRGPVMRNVVPPQVEFVSEPLGVQTRCERLRAIESTRGVLPLTLPADEKKAHPPAQPLEVIALQVRDVVHRVVEIEGIVTPAVSHAVSYTHLTLPTIYSV